MTELMIQPDSRAYRAGRAVAKMDFAEKKGFFIPLTANEEWREGYKDQWRVQGVKAGDIT